LYIQNKIIALSLCQQEAPVQVLRQRVYLNLQNEGGCAGVDICT